MGYYSQLELSGEVKKYDKNKLENLNRILAGEVESPFDVWGFHGGKFTIEDGSVYVDLNDYYAKFYDAQDVANYLADVIKDGHIQMILKGEDGYIHGYFIRPKQVIDIYPVYVPEEILDKVHAIVDEYYKSLDAEKQKRKASSRKPAP